MAKNAVLLIAMAALFALAMTSAESAASGAAAVVSHGVIRGGRELKQAAAPAPVDDDGADDGDDEIAPGPVDDDGADDGDDEIAPAGSPVSDDDSQGANIQATSFAPAAVVAGVGSLLMAALAA